VIPAVSGKCGNEVSSGTIGGAEWAFCGNG
jgi:hypothetical protein